MAGASSGMAGRTEIVVDMVVYTLVIESLYSEYLSECYARRERLMSSETTPTFAQFRAYMQEMEGFNLNRVDEGEMGVVRADEDGLTLFTTKEGMHDVYYDAIAPWFDRLLVQRFLSTTLLEEDFGAASLLVASLFLQLDGVRYEAESQTLFWFDTPA